MEAEKHIVILDFGGQYAHLIARRVRQCGVFSEIREPETLVSELKNAAGIILSGGPQSVYDKASPQGDPKLFELGIPVLGICYGLHWMVQTLGGKVSSGKVKEYGHTSIRNLGVGGGAIGSLLEKCPSEFTVWMSHGDEAAELPPGFKTIATSEACANAALADPSRNFFAVQFHPEVTHSEHGMDILQSFVDLCDATPWSVKSYTQKLKEEVVQEVGDRKVFMLVSGGVDSTVAFALLNEVLGVDRVQGLLVDTGLMRKNEVKMIQSAFDTLGITNLRVEDASSLFFEKLKGIYEPEAKRKMIGDTFLEVQKTVSTEMNLKLEDGWMLGQGTIYPDTIETGATKHADQIKTHHNRVEAIQKMIDQGLVIEPLKDLYKDEVRALGEELGLPHELVWRHPFPGPGLGVRILCAKESSPLDKAQYDIPVPHLPLPIKSVGVQGDSRSYRHPVALFSTEKVPSAEHWKLATSIPNAIHEFNRVMFCVSHTEPMSLIFTPGYITKERADLLRDADNIVDEEMRAAGLYESIWQFPVVLLPVGTKEGEQSIVLRPIESQEAMTAKAINLSKDVLEKMTKRLLAIPGIGIVFLDLTHKPPGTIEWE